MTSALSSDKRCKIAMYVRIMDLKWGLSLSTPNILSNMDETRAYTTK